MGALGVAALLAGTGAATPATTAELAAHADSIVAGAPGTVGFSTTCGNPPRTISAGEETQLRGASTLKVGIALADAIARRASEQEMESDGLLRSAIVDSSNSSANALFERAGLGSTSAGVQATNDLFASLGMDRTRFDGPYVDTSARSQKVTTAGDLRLLAEALQRLAADGSGALSRAGASQGQARAILSFMRQSTYPSVFADASGAQIAHKSGWLNDAQNDLAVITLPDGGPCVAGFVSEGLSLPQAQEVGSRLAREVVLPLAAAAGPAPATRTVTTAPTTPTAPTTSTAPATIETAPEATGATRTPATRPPPAAIEGSAGDASTWFGDWRVWALVALAAIVVLTLLRQRQLSRRRRERSRRRR